MSPIQPSRSLTGEVISRLVEEITSGRLGAGQRLPTEQEMMTSMKVSRTVVREAIAALKAQGLVITRQGSGAFVSMEPVQRSFHLAPEILRSLDSVINVLELRLAVETEAAGLACTRGVGAGHRAIRAAHAAFEKAVAASDIAADEDFAFHVAIANATDNRQFPEFLKFLGTIVIPRQNLRVWSMTFANQAEYLARISQEHREIVDAITGRDPDAARDAMRRHLTLAADRYRRFFEAAQSGEITLKEETIPQ